jgi:hypothetical protein
MREFAPHNVDRGLLMKQAELRRTNSVIVNDKVKIERQIIEG